jgi:hypothetical protein
MHFIGMQLHGEINFLSLKTSEKYVILYDNANN